jgi:hypothetical protein
MALLAYPNTKLPIPATNIVYILVVSIDQMLLKLLMLLTMILVVVALRLAGELPKGASIPSDVDNAIMSLYRNFPA